MSTLQLADVLKDQIILAVDDEPDSLVIARKLLKLYGADILTAQDGQEGLALAREYHPLFIISDLSMPEMSGWEMLHQLQADPRTANIPVVALTAHVMAGDRARALAAGFHNYMIKPLQPETFVEDLLRVVVDTPALAKLLKSND